MVTSRNRSHSSRRGNAWESALLAASLIGGALVQAAAGRHGMAAWPAWLGMFPLFVAIRVLPPGRAALAGALWGGAGAVFHAALGELSVPSLAAMAWVAIPSAFALAGALLTRWIGFSPLVLSVLWLCLEVMTAPISPRPHRIALAASLPSLGEAIPLLGFVYMGFLAAAICGGLVDVIERAAGAARASRTVPVALRPPQLRLGSAAPLPLSRGKHLLSLPRAPPCAAILECMQSCGRRQGSGVGSDNWFPAWSP